MSTLDVISWFAKSYDKCENTRAIINDILKEPGEYFLISYYSFKSIKIYPTFYAIYNKHTFVEMHFL